MMHRTTLTDLDETAVATRAARGERAAFDELHHRHGPVAWRLAVVASTAAAQAVDAVAEGLARTVAGITASPSTHPLRLDLLTATRTASISTQPGVPARDADWPPAPGDADATELRLLDAYRDLPEHYRSTLWLLESERFEAHQAGCVLGLPSDAVGLLHLRARAGLRQAVAARQLQTLEHEGAPDVCQRATRALSASRTGRLGAVAQRAVDRHLEGCVGCQARLGELDAAPLGLRAVIELPALPGPDAAWTRFRALTAAAEVRPLGLALPGGRPVPLWAERALAGAAAAAISLGIAGAIVMGARSEAGPGQGRAPEIAAQAGAAGSGKDGSGTGIDTIPATPLDPVTLDAAPPPPSLGSSGGSGTSGTSSASGGSRPAERVRGTSGTSPATPAPSTGADPAPSEPAPDQPGPSQPPASEAPAPEPAPVPSDPPGQIDVDLGDLGLSVGESCTGIKLGTTTLGCDTAGTTDTESPLQVGDEPVPLPGLG